MKKKMVIGVLSASLILGGALAVGASNNDDKNETSQAVSESNTMISAEKAKEIALSIQKGQVEEIELDSDHGKQYYEVDFEDSEKDIYIDAYTGEVLAIEEADNDDHDDDWDQGSKTANQNVISEQEAVKIAEEATNGTVTEIELDEDDNMLIYEVELKTKRGEAEVDIDAATGKVIDLD